MKLKNFLVDFFFTLFHFVWYSVLGIVEIISQILLGLKKLVSSYLVPLTNNLLSDLAYISLILWQGFLCIFSSLCLFLSKQLYGLAKVSHQESERALQKLWMSE